MNTAPITSDNNIANLAGEVTASEAMDFLAKSKSAFLVDVRTDLEWNNVGTPDLTSIDKDVIKLSWRVLPNMALNQNFNSELAEKIPSKDAEIFFLCKVGGRSYEAAVNMARAGYSKCYNIVAGFEGMSEDGSIKGWLAQGLPIHKS